jgi:hypothetical protein
MLQVKACQHGFWFGYNGKTCYLWSGFGYRGKTCELWSVSGYRGKTCELVALGYREQPMCVTMLRYCLGLDALSAIVPIVKPFLL